MTLRCVIVDDSRAVLQAATELLEREGINVVGVAATGEQAMRLVRNLEPNVLLIDIDLGAESGLALARRVANSSVAGACRTVLMSTYDEADFAPLIADSPAIGFLAKSELSAAAIRELVERAQAEGRS